MEPIWFLIFLIFWSVIIVAVGYMLVRRIHRAGRDVRRDSSRPTYQFGNSIADWEQACRESYNWSRARRSNKAREEVKS